MFFPYYLIADAFLLWMLGFLLTSLLIALVVILRAFRSPYRNPYRDEKDERQLADGFWSRYADKKDARQLADGFWSRFSFVHPSYQDEKDEGYYEGMKRSLLRNAETLARGLSGGD